MTANAIQLVGSAFALVVLTGCVGVSLLCFALLMALWVGLFLSFPVRPNRWVDRTQRHIPSSGPACHAGRVFIPDGAS